MTKIDIFSGFLGAGKTTLIKKLIAEVYKGEKVVLIENEFGEIGIDGGFLKESGINITEMNSGCICCSLVGDFSKALNRVMAEYAPERIVIEPSGVGKLSDIVAAVEHARLQNAEINALCAVVDAGKCKMYMKNFGEFFNDQIRSASCIVMSHADKCSDEKLQTAVALVRAENPNATLITTPLTLLSGKDILAAMEKKDTLQAELEKLAAEHAAHMHAHHHHEDGEECCHHHHEEEDEHCHHHHEDGEECCHHHGEEGHNGHHHHHADDVFTSWGTETTHRYTQAEISAMLGALADEEKYGVILRAKGMVAGEDGGQWIHFDYVPDEPDVRRGSAGVTGRLCVIGCNLKEDALRALFKA